MSSMRHHNVFRHREFASFLRARGSLPPAARPRTNLTLPPPPPPPSAAPSIALPPLPALPSLAASPASLSSLHPLPLPGGANTASAERLLTLPLSSEGGSEGVAGNVASFAKSTAVASAKKRPREETDDVGVKLRKKEATPFAPVTSPTAVANVLTPGGSGVGEAVAAATELRASLGTRSSSERTEEADESQLTPGFDCELCQTRFFRKHHLERHIQNIHQGQRPWTCDICGFAFHQKPNLERHIMTVHQEQRPFRCNVCEMSFGRKGVLKKHVQMVHEHSRKFECEICKISFGLKSDLKRHVQSVHQKKRPFVCEVCSASFGRRSDLKRHTISLHPGAALPSKRNSAPSSAQSNS